MVGEPAWDSQLGDARLMAHWPPSLPLFQQTTQDVKNGQLSTEHKDEPRRAERLQGCPQPKLWTQRSQSYMHVCCCKPLSFGMFCCAAKADVYKIKGIHIFTQYCLFWLIWFIFVHVANIKLAPTMCEALSEVLWCHVSPQSGGHAVVALQPSDCK